MTYRVADDERLVLPERSVLRGERIYIRELTEFLGYKGGIVRRFAKRSGLIKRVSVGATRAPAEYVTVYGAMRVIAYIRALQGDMYNKGRMFHEERERARGNLARRKARSESISVPMQAEGRSRS